jgi:hypothetical protein
MEYTMGLRLKLNSINNLFIVLCCCLFSNTVGAQTYSLIGSYELKTNINKISSDNYKTILLTDEHGTVYKLDSNLKVLNIFSPPKRSRVSLIEASRTMNIFLFYENFQEYLLLDRFFNQSQSITLSRDRVGFARCATIALDNNVWIFDDIEFSLKKFNTQFEKVDFSTPLELVLDAEDYQITFMREYQNLLYVADTTSGALVFDNFGIYKTRFPYKGIKWFSFYKDEMTFVKNQELVLYHLYTFKERKLALPEPCDKALFYGNKIYCIKNKVIRVYQMN